MAIPTENLMEIPDSMWKSLIKNIFETILIGNVLCLGCNLNLGAGFGPIITPCLSI